MSKQTVNQVIQRAIGDAAFRRELQRDPSSALAGFDLSTDERAAITSGDPTRLTALGVDQRMSKAFGLGGMSDVSKTVIGDTGSAGSAAFIDEGSSAGTSAIVSPTTAEGGTMVVTDADAQSLAAGYTSGDGASSSVIVGDPSADTSRGFETPDGNSLDAGFVGGSGATASAFESLDTTGDLNVIDPGIVEPGTSAVDPAEGTQVEDLNQGY